MKTTYDFKKLRRLITIYVVVQVVLVGLLIYMALNFQAQMSSDRFLKAVVITLIIQTALFYPINRFANREAGREVDSSATGLTPDDLKGLRTKRMFGDVARSALARISCNRSGSGVSSRSMCWSRGRAACTSMMPRM